MRVKLLCLLGGTLLTGITYAGGFQVNLQGQKQIGMGHTGVGLARDQASIFFNPGALARLRQNGFQVGISPLISKTAYQEPEPGNASTVTDNPLGTPFQVYGSYGFANDKARVGIGVYTPYGSSVNWGTTWQGRFGLNELTLRTIFIQPTFSYAITDRISVGAGPVFAIGNVNLQRSIPLQEANRQEGHVELDGGAKGYGFNAGIYFQATDNISVGINYRSKVKMEVKEGDAIFTTPAAPPIASRFPAGTNFDATLPLPANITLGVGIKANDKLTIAADAQLVQWSAYKSLRFDYSQLVNGSEFTENARNYQDVVIFRLGAEYAVSDQLQVRAGAYLDQSPVEDGYLTPETPDSDAIGLSAGLSYQVTSNIGIDASFLYVNRKKRSDAANLSGGVPGTFKSVGYIPGIAVNYNF
ncbi:OmpP1/FadL family transporter [Adhaeribacter radiodurans]|uniref:Outer membrane protein transport protein n=1 Tax=Adhaeribacter radiodurans TaxID=2745197 RepID=A0A7L7LBK4_9BACT|nr:outer membrane protein transport protein [Adhaeribacter radiodurans]QMU30210.1 outer membrane protein transport protein [Adhaeribacter radiodurans]